MNAKQPNNNVWENRARPDAGSTENKRRAKTQKESQTEGARENRAGRSGRAGAGAETSEGAETAAWEENVLEAEDAWGDSIQAEILEGTPGPESETDEAGQLRDQLLRLSADFDNFRKRAQKEKQDWSLYASQNIMEKLLPVADSFDAAVNAVANAGQEAKNMAEGFLLIHRQFTEILNQAGLKEINALGEIFDHNIHDAVMTVNRAKDQEENQIVLVLRKGYMFHDKVLRPAMVQVAKDE